jgi:uncharacterized protein (TIGR04255 family)
VTTTSSFPIPIPKRLPVRIHPCPIVEAIFEVRFVGQFQWTVLPGILYSNISEKYPEQKVLPLQLFPEELRSRDPSFAFLPHLQFIGDQFIVQAGPRMLSLTTKTHEYPGWESVRRELDWLLKKIETAKAIKETERIGVRYIDFFPGDVLSQLVLGIRINDRPLTEAESTVATVMRSGPLTIRLQITNAAIVKGKETAQKGTVIDADAWFGAIDASAFEDGLQPFEEAHGAIKETFFGLLKPEFLATLQPEY